MSFKIRKTNALYVLLILPLLVPSSLYVYPAVLSVVKILKLIAFGYSLYLLTGSTLRKEKMLWLVGAYCIFLLISTVIQGGQIYTWFSTLYPYFTICVLVCSWYLISGDEALDILATIFSMFLLLNIISWLMGGLYVDKTSSFGTERIVYFWGIRNSLTHCLLPMSVIILINAQNIKNRKLKLLTELLVVVLNVAIALSMKLVTALIGVASFAVIYVVNGSRYRELPKWNKLLFWIVIASTMSISVFGMNNSFIQDIMLTMGKGTTFNGRTYIWDSIISQMNDLSWIIGHGIGQTMAFSIQGAVTSTTHSQYLYILFESGVVGLVLFFRIIYGQLRPLFMLELGNEKRIIFSGIMCILIAAIVENVCNNCYFYVMLCACYCCIKGQMVDSRDEQA